jgi:DNA-binding cell septation regulator SpoVG
MQIENIEVEIRFSTKPGPVKAYADVEMRTTNGSLKEHGYAIIQKDQKPPFVGFPSRPGNISGKFFPIIEAEGDIRQAILDQILRAYKSADAQRNALP